MITTSTHAATGAGTHLPMTLTHPLYALGLELQQAQYRLTTPTPATIARVSERRGNAQARHLNGIFGWSRTFDPAITPAPILDAMHDASVAVQTETGLRSAVRVSSIGKNLYFHAAYPTLDADCVFSGPDIFGEELDEPAYAGTDRIAAVWLKATKPLRVAA